MSTLKSRIAAAEKVLTPERELLVIFVRGAVPGLRANAGSLELTPTDDETPEAFIERAKQTALGAGEPIVAIFGLAPRNGGKKTLFSNANESGVE